MPINPYESPHTEPSTAPARPIVRIPAAVSILIVVTGGVIGGSLFLTGMQGMYLLARFQGINWLLTSSVPFQTGLAAGIPGSLLVLLGTDWYVQRRRPAYGSAIVGSLIASPIAFIIAFNLGLLAYDLGETKASGGGLVALLAFYSFFLTLSLGGWLGICFVRRRAKSGRSPTSDT